MPSSYSQHVNAALTRVAREYQNQTYIADKVCPRIKVSKESDTYYLFGQEKYGVPKTLRAQGAEYSDIDYALSTDTYSCDDYGIKRLIENRELRNADPAVDPKQTTTNLISEILKLGKEIRVGSLLTTSGNYLAANTAALAGGDRWDTPTAVPITNIDTYKQLVVDAGGKVPNVIILGSAVWTKVKQQATIMDQLKYVGKNSSLDALAELFGVQKVYVGQAVYNSANQGLTPVLTSVWGKNVVGVYVPPELLVEPEVDAGYTEGIGKETPTFAAQFVFDPLTIVEYPDPHEKGIYVRGNLEQDEKVTGSSFGFLLRTVVS